ncbi:MAG: MFS transporter [Actinobacteria bacterium]|uniref:Unannotated protein n=1 Tax=freshwater metagenome TaxID=449393 RepID=A0A6J5YR14_9ZZZZ|nr:MFS transporter [Actinomycetota bacterium]
MENQSAGSTLRQAWPLIAFSLTLRPLVTSVGPVLPEIRDELGMSATQASLLTVLPVICFALGAFIVPRLLTRISPNAGVTIALLLMAFGGHLRLVHHTSWLLVGTVICGFGAAIGNILGGLVTRRDFATKVGLVMGMYVGLMSVTSSAAAMTSFPLAHLAGSWRWSLEVWAALPILVLIGWMYYSHEHQDNKRMLNRPAYRHIARNKMAWWLVIYFGFQSTNFHSLAGWLPSILRDSGIPPTQAGLMVSLMILLGVPAGILVPPLAARSDSQRFLVIATITVSFIGLIGVWQAPTLAPWVWASCLGLGVGSSFPLALTLAITKADTTDAARDLSAFMQSWGYVISAIGPFALGILRDLTGNWSVAVLALVIGTFVQLIAGLIISRPGHIHVSASQ